MRIDLRAHIKGLDGEDLEKDNKEMTLGKQLGYLLASGNPDGIEPVKAFDWAMLLHKTGELEVDRADLEKIISAVTYAKTMSNLLKGQLIIALKINSEG